MIRKETCELGVLLGIIGGMSRRPVWVASIIASLGSNTCTPGCVAVIFVTGIVV